MMTTPSPTLNASSRIMREAAEQRGIVCEAFGDHETLLMSQGDLQWYTRGSRTSLQSSVGKTIADVKPLTKMVLERFHIPTAKGIHVRTPADLTTVEQLQFPVVMKPIDERHGKGVHVGIVDLAQLRQQLGAQPWNVLVEEQLRGIEYRIVCVDYQFVAAAFRKPAHVVGDGVATIQELIDAKNRHPWRGEGHANNLTTIQVDEVVEEVLAEQQFSLTSVPAANQEVLLRKTANLSTGGEAWDVTDEVCAENRQLFEQIAHVCDLSVIGIDMMCDSLSTPIHLQPHAGVIEVNASPGLRMHHYPLQGKPRDVAGHILDHVMTQLSSQKSR